MAISFFSVGLGVGTQNQKGEWLEVFYPQPLLNPSAQLSAVFADSLCYQGGNAVVNLEPSRLKNLENSLQAIGERSMLPVIQSMQSSTQPLVAILLATDDKPRSVPESYLKLHLLSHRLVKPHTINLESLFATLPNVAWTSQGAIDLNELADKQLQGRVCGTLLSVNCIDKFPKMTDYVVPSGVRIADTARVRLGAYIGKGTTIMHEGFVNFNAGTSGPGMVEGRISAGVFIGSGSDLGGGSSTMGTLSGGGDIVISMGEGCLLGANAGIGIPLGDRCTVESGLYITAGTKVVVLDEQGREVKRIKARDLANRSDLLFRRNSLSGTVECLTNRSVVALNKMLHVHQ